jgi:signal transduction histidine kinase
LFRICARTVLELGAELISSDVIAFYELAKNAFDAQSPDGAEIRFEIALRKNQYLKLRDRVSAKAASVPLLIQEIERALDASAPAESIQGFRAKIGSAQSHKALVDALDSAEAEWNRIIVSDRGVGMSRNDLSENYLVIGTPSRKKAIEAALAGRSDGISRPPFLGEKGIGRLSAMRLGDRLTVETAQREDRKMNLLKIDWSAFNNLDAMLDEIDVIPELGGPKPDGNWSGTRLTIGSINADWTLDRVRHLAENDFARLTDPFGDTKRRPRIAIFWNGNRVPISLMDRHLLSHAHATVKGEFKIGPDGLRLECRYEAIDLGFNHPHEVQRREFTLADLEGAISGTSREVPMSALNDLGEFSFEAYWFNRQRLGGIDSIGDRKVVRDLQRRWSGILLFRDGFRVLPYGDDDDDWLALDRRALASTGYLLNKTQFVGRVNITRLGNPRLIDQTNREGLRVGPEQQAFIGLLQLAIQSQLRDFLTDVQARHKNQPLNLDSAKTNIASLEKRSVDALKRIKKIAPQTSDTVEDLQQAFFELKEFFDQAQRRIDEIEDENRQMVQMAGVGLLVEVVAHELARSTENALGALEALRDKNLPDQVKGQLETLRSEMTSLSKRIRVLDPLSVSGRQRKETFDIVALTEDILSGHEVQFARHGIRPKIIKPDRPIRIKAVKGMLIQIIENLISNSVYWMDVRKQSEPEFHPKITITFENSPFTLTYEDNGRGIAKENRETVFRAFYSLKEKSKRRGLGLFIARECAEYHGGTLTLDEHINRETGRLHRFILELPSEAVAS